MHAVQLQQHLGIACGAEHLAALFQVRTQGSKVIDLAVENNDVARHRVVHGLAGAFVQVQHGKARMAKAG